VKIQGKSNQGNQLYGTIKLGKFTYLSEGGREVCPSEWGIAKIYPEDVRRCGG